MGVHHSKATDGLPQEELEELKGCTDFRGSEIQRFYDKFMKDYPSGVITKPEFIQTYKNMYPDGKKGWFHYIENYKHISMLF